MLLLKYSMRLSNVHMTPIIVSLQDYGHCAILEWKFELKTYVATDDVTITFHTVCHEGNFCATN